MSFGIQTEYIDSSEISLPLKKELPLLVSNTFDHVKPDYLISCLKRYPKVGVVRSGSSISGVFFCTQFEIAGKYYLYLGPAFFKKRFYFLKAYLDLCTAMLGMSEDECFILAEVQNPELVFVAHTLLKDLVFPSPFDFEIPQEIRNVLELFIANTPQLGTMNLENFRSYNGASESLYKPSSKIHPVTLWLEEKGISLRNGDALALIMVVNNQILRQIQKKIIRLISTYPVQRKKYFDRLSMTLSIAGNV